jgi:hypothetical protein
LGIPFQDTMKVKEAKNIHYSIVNGG